MKKIQSLKKRKSITHKRLNQRYSQLDQLISLLRKQELDNEYVDWLNDCIQEINATSDDIKELKQVVYEKQNEILRLLEDELNLVPRKHYQNRWMLIGMVFIGIPTGILVGYTLKNIDLSIIGIPLGYAIGMLIGIKKDKKAQAAGKQLDIFIKY